MVHCENSFNLVCRSGILSVNRRASSSVAFSWSSKNVLANVAEPTGVPKRRNPSVSSIAKVVPSECFVVE